MNNFAKFLSVNGLKRKDIASFLGVSGAFITQITSGDRPLPLEKLAMIKSNAYNWDTSMLDTPLLGMDTLRESPKTFTRDHIHAAIESVMDPSTNFIVNYLERKVADLEKKVDELLKENAILKYESTMSKGEESADSAEDSSSANVG